MGYSYLYGEKLSAKLRSEYYGSGYFWGEVENSNPFWRVMGKLTEIHRVLKKNQRNNVRNKYNSIEKQTMRHTGYHPTGCGATTDF